MSVRELLDAKARELAEHDGVSVTVMHVHAAVANLAAELRREFDAMVASLRPAGSAIVSAPAPEASPEPAAQEPAPIGAPVSAEADGDPAANAEAAS